MFYFREHGYANVITDFLPEDLEFLPEHEINTQYRWTVSEDGRVVTTDYLSKDNEEAEGQNLLHAFNGQNLDYKDVQIACKVKEEAKRNIKLTNSLELVNLPNLKYLNLAESKYSKKLEKRLARDIEIDKTLM